MNGQCFLEWWHIQFVCAKKTWLFSSPLIQVSPQDTWSQPQGTPLQRALTPLGPEDARTALEIYKLV